MCHHVVIALLQQLVGHGWGVGLLLVCAPWFEPPKQTEGGGTGLSKCGKGLAQASSDTVSIGVLAVGWDACHQASTSDGEGWDGRGQREPAHRCKVERVIHIAAYRRTTCVDSQHGLAAPRQARLCAALREEQAHVRLDFCSLTLRRLTGFGIFRMLLELQ